MARVRQLPEALGISQPRGGGGERGGIGVS